MYSCAILDPRPNADNSKVLGANTLGIEVTVSALAAQCGLGNLDPQHTGGDVSRAAIEDALTADLPPEGSTLVTVRADLDAVGAMAIFSIRARGESLESAMERINMVAVADKFARGGYPGSKAFPTRENPWPEAIASAESSKTLAAIAAAVMDFKVQLIDRVATMENWLLTGEEPKQYRDSVEKERLDLIVALETRQIKIESVDGWIAVVETTHRSATLIGYSVAPVVIALNPEFRIGAGESHRKFTICQFSTGFVDLTAILVEFNEFEPGWGGSSTIIGSPQGEGSVLTINHVVEVVKKHCTLQFG